MAKAQNYQSNQKAASGKAANNYINTRQELRNILKAYPKLSMDSINLFTRVYYPVAQVEFEMTEKSFEDFESIQKTVMQLLDIGVTDIDVIADTLGLTPAYINGMVNRLLTGRGLVRDGQLTELGRESLSTDRFLAQVTVRELFSIDALNGNILRLPELVSEDKLRKRNNTEITVGHLNLIDGVRVSELVEQIEKNGLHRYLVGKKSTNIVSINSVQLKDIQYAQAYLIGIDGFERPVIFAKRSADPENESDQNGLWLPFSVDTPKLRALLDAGCQIPDSSLAAKKYTDSILEQLDAAAQKRAESVDGDIERIMLEKYRLDIGRMRKPETKGHMRIYQLAKEAFVGCNKNTLELLLGAAENGTFMVTVPRFFGVTLSFAAKDNDIRRAAETIAEKLPDTTRTRLFSYLIDNLELSDASDVIRSINELLSRYDGEKDQT